MKTLRRLCAAFLLTLILALSAFAGDMSTGRTGEMSTGRLGDMSTTVAATDVGSQDCVESVSQHAGCVLKPRAYGAISLVQAAVTGGLVMVCLGPVPEGREIARMLDEEALHVTAREINALVKPLAINISLLS